MSSIVPCAPSARTDLPSFTGKIGTTGKGIGPTYTDKISRNGLRVGDLLHNFDEKYAHNGIFQGNQVDPAATTFTSCYGTELMSYRTQFVACFIKQLCRERTATDTCTICLEDTVYLTDITRRDTQSRTASGTDRVGRGRLT